MKIMNRHFRVDATTGIQYNFYIYDIDLQCIRCDLVKMNRQTLLISGLLAICRCFNVLFYGMCNKFKAN